MYSFKVLFMCSLFFKFKDCAGAVDNASEINLETMAPSNESIETPLDWARSKIGSELTEYDEDHSFVVAVTTLKSDGEVEVLCNGILVNSTAVLCSVKCAANPPPLEIHYGSLNVTNGFTRNVDKVELLNDTTYSNDIVDGYKFALLRLDKPISEIKDVGYSDLFNSNDEERVRMQASITEEGLRCMALGFGVSGVSQVEAGVMRIYNISLLPSDICDKLNIEETDENHVCTSLSRNDECFYEDGAPLICKGRIVGLFTLVNETDVCSSKNAFVPLHILTSLPEIKTDNQTGVSETHINHTDYDHINNFDNTGNQLTAFVSTTPSIKMVVTTNNYSSTLNSTINNSSIVKNELKSFIREGKIQNYESSRDTSVGCAASTNSLHKKISLHDQIIITMFTFVTYFFLLN